MKGLPVPSASGDRMVNALLSASRLLLAISARSLAQIDEGITLPQFRLMVVLENQGPLNLSQLADELEVNVSTITRTVDKLVDSGCVRDSTAQDSTHARLVELTPGGLSVIHTVFDFRRREIAYVVERMPVAQQTGLIAALEAFTRAGGENPIGGLLPPLLGAFPLL